MPGRRDSKMTGTGRKPKKWPTAKKSQFQSAANRNPKQMAVWKKWYRDINDDNEISRRLRTGRRY